MTSQPFDETALAICDMKVRAIGRIMLRRSRTVHENKAGDERTLWYARRRVC
jgi:hypothetical protein